MTASLPGTVLVVDDDADTRANLRDILELDELMVETAATAAEVLARADWADVSAVLLDRKLPDGTADELLPRLRQLAPDASVLIVTGSSDLQGAIAALRQGAADYILKPIDPEALRASLLRVADRQQLTRARARSDAAFAALVEAAPSLIVILRPDGPVLYLNHFAEELTGHDAAAVIGRDFSAVFTPEGGLDLSSTGTTEAAMPCRDGSRRWVAWNARRLDDYEGGPAVLVVGQDITPLKQAQERTLQAERLAAIGQMVTGLAHESGNALARSQACLEMLGLEVRDRPKAVELVGRVQKAQDHLQLLYEEVRNYAAPLRLERLMCRLDTVWRQAWANLALRREGRDARLLEGCAGVEVRCRVDAFRLEQVFRNVFENALAACRDPVEVRVTCREAGLDGRPALVVSVRDNGPGLGAEQRQRIFEPFFTTKTKGTGLGMAIAQRIVEAHGGRITLGPGPGAEVVIHLPREAP